MTQTQTHYRVVALFLRLCYVLHFKVTICVFRSQAVLLHDLLPQLRDSVHSNNDVDVRIAAQLMTTIENLHAMI
jgi:hypothetical protein